MILDGLRAVAVLRPEAEVLQGIAVTDMQPMYVEGARPANLQGVDDLAFAGARTLEYKRSRCAARCTDCACSPLHSECKLLPRHPLPIADEPYLGMKLSKILA